MKDFKKRKKTIKTREIVAQSPISFPLQFSLTRKNVQ